MMALVDKAVLTIIMLFLGGAVIRASRAIVALWDGENQGSKPELRKSASRSGHYVAPAPGARTIRNLLYLVIAAVSTVLGFTLIRDTPRLQEPPNVAGGIFLLVDASGRASPASVAVNITEPSSAMPHVTALIESKSEAAVVISGNMLPRGTVGYSADDSTVAGANGQLDEQLSPAATLVSVTSTAGAQTETLGSLDQLKRGDVQNHIPGIASDAVYVRVPSGSSYLRWDLVYPLARSGRGYSAGAIPEIGSASEGIITDNLIINGLLAPPDKEEEEEARRLEQKLPPDERENLERLRRRSEQLRSDTNALKDALIALDARQTEASSSVPIGLAARFELRGDMKSWYTPSSAKAAVSAGELESGVQLDNAVPDVAGRRDVLAWSAPSGTGQVPLINWQTSDISNQQSASDRFFIAGLVLAVPVALVIALLDSSFEHRRPTRTDSHKGEGSDEGQSHSTA